MAWFEYLESLAQAKGCHLGQTRKGNWYLATPDGSRWDLGPTPRTDGGYIGWAKRFEEAGII